MTPGQDTALTIRSAVAGGRWNGLATAAGVASGQALWTVVAGIGLSALITSSPALLVVLRLLGSAYLLLLGCRAIWAAWHEPAQQASQNVGHRRADPVAAYAQGLLSNLSNPKMLVFFTSLLPQFAKQLSGFLSLGFAFCAMTLIWLTAYALVLSSRCCCLAAGWSVGQSTA